MDSVRVKIKFRPSSVPDKEGSISYKVCYKDINRNILTGYRIFPHEWENHYGKIIILPGIEEKRKQYLFAIRKAIQKDVSRLKEIIEELENSGEHRAPDVIMRRFLDDDPLDMGFFAFTSKLIEKFMRSGKHLTAERYGTVINSFKRFRENVEVPIAALDVSIMMEYEGFLKANGLCANTISFYMRGLRAIYNRAVEEDLAPQRNPFRKVYTGIGKTAKRAIAVDVVRRIQDLDLSSDPPVEFARDVFMFSFYTRGMSFIDIAYLRKSNLEDGVLYYERQKTGQKLRIKWEKEMQAIVDLHSEPDSPFLLSIIKDPAGDMRRQYKSAAHNVNYHLKKIGKMLGLTAPLTSYVARHAWASIAKAQRIPITTISEAMGHESETTTRIYLASFDSSEVDNANKKILKLVKREK